VRKVFSGYESLALTTELWARAGSRRQDCRLCRNAGQVKSRQKAEGGIQDSEFRREKVSNSRFKNQVATVRNQVSGFASLKQGSCISSISWFSSLASFGSFAAFARHWENGTVQPRKTLRGIAAAKVASGVSPDVEPGRLAQRTAGIEGHNA